MGLHAQVCRMLLPPPPVSEAAQLPDRGLEQPALSQPEQFLSAPVNLLGAKFLLVGSISGL